MRTLVYLHDTCAHHNIADVIEIHWWFTSIFAVHRSKSRLSNCDTIWALSSWTNKSKKETIAITFIRIRIAAAGFSRFADCNYCTNRMMDHVCLNVCCVWVCRNHSSIIERVCGYIHKLYHLLLLFIIEIYSLIINGETLSIRVRYCKI